MGRTSSRSAATLGGLAAAILLSLPAIAHAQDSYTYCVDQAQDGADFTSCGTCDNAAPYFASIADALATIEAAPDASTGSRPDLTLCVDGDHAETLPTIDMALVARSIGLTMVAGHLCPGPAHPAGAPMFDLVGYAGDPGFPNFAFFEALDGSTCTAQDFTAVQASDVQLDLQGFYRNLSGPLISATSSSGDHSVSVTNASVEAIDGPVFDGNTGWYSSGLEISGSVSAGEPLLQFTGTSTTVEFDRRSVLFANIVQGGVEQSPMLRVEGPDLIVRGHLLANTVLGGGPLVEVIPPDSQRTQLVLIHTAEFARNALRSAGTAPAPQRYLSRPGGFDPCQPTWADGIDYGVVLPAREAGGPSPPAVSALVSIAGFVGGSTKSVVLQSSKTWWVENEVGLGGALVAVDGAVEDTHLLFLHNTVSDQGVQLVDGSGAAGGGALTTVANLLLGGQSFDLGPGWDSAETILDQVESGHVGWFAQASGLAHRIPGPVPERDLWPVSFRSDSDLDGFTICEQMEQLCPDLSDYCSNPTELSTCPQDAGKGYLLQTQLLDDAAATWPWPSTVVADYEAGEQAGIVGAEGFQCLNISSLPIGYDQLWADVSTSLGDGDGYSRVVDCDNDDPAVVPSLPVEDGFATNTCVSAADDCYDCPPVDADGDGLTAAEGDCDDGDPTIRPGAPEACDAIDQDCDGDLVESFTNTDADAEPDCIDEDDDGDGSLDVADCLPLHADVYAGAPAACDGVDTDCDGALEAGEDDGDGDGYTVCEPYSPHPSLAVPGLGGGDCDDADASVSPDSVEACDGLDTDCDPASTLPDDVDADGDGDPACASDCDDADPAVSGLASEACDGLDNDCDGVVPDDEEDEDGDGVSICAGDCDDEDSAAYPGGPEQCDAIDQDCDGDALDGFGDLDGDTLPDCIDPDADGDGAEGALGDGSDCDDAADAVFPGATPTCDAVDDDCDGAVADGFADLDGDDLPDCADADADGDGAEGAALGNGTDCDDANDAVFPGATPTCDAVDDDCDGAVADGFGDQDLDDLPDCVDDSDGDGAFDEVDCEPESPSANPSAAEVCDGLDTDCDGALLPDEGDADRDGWLLCDDAEFVAPDGVDGPDGGGDCDDEDADVNPGAAEVCDGLDTDCDGVLGPGDEDSDGDGVAACLDCNDSSAAQAPGNEEVCDGLDTDCDGDVPVDEITDADADGAVVCADCDDVDAARAPDATEVCDGLDNDCDGELLDDEVDADDDGVLDCAFVDADGDGHSAGADCDDGDPTVNPDATDYCDMVDQDCDGSIVEDWGDADGDGRPDCIPPLGATDCSNVSGCGIHWAPANALLLAWLPLGALRRRR